MLLFVICVLPFLSASASSFQQEADYAAIQSSGVSAVIYDKIRFGNELNLDDIKALTRARVNDDIILRYLRNLCTVYYLKNSEVRDLRAAGVSPNVINYMLKTLKLFRPTSYPAGPGSHYDPYWFGPSQYRNGY